MQEEADLGRGEHVPEHLRHHREVVIVHPDEVAVPVNVLDGVSEALVDGLSEEAGRRQYWWGEGGIGVVVRESRSTVIYTS